MRAMAYDSQTAGYNTFNTVSVRLWTALPIFGNENKKNNAKAEFRQPQFDNKAAASASANIDQYRNIIEIRKEIEKITCAPYPKDPE
jgi:hypothetical protein